MLLTLLHIIFSIVVYMPKFWPWAMTPSIIRIYGCWLIIYIPSLTCAFICISWLSTWKSSPCRFPSHKDDDSSTPVLHKSYKSRIMTDMEQENATYRETFAQFQGKLDTFQGNMNTIIEYIPARKATTSTSGQSCYSCGYLCHYCCHHFCWYCCWYSDSTCSELTDLLVES